MNKIFIYTIIVSFISISVFAQEEKKDLGTEVINVIKAYSPEVSDAFKIKSSPENKVDETKKQELSYDTYSTDVASTFKPSKIGAKSQPKNKVQKTLDNYVILGYGNYKTPLVELYMNNKKVKEERYGIHVQHLSSEGGIENVMFNNSFMNSSIDGFYWKQFKNYQLKSNLAYKYQSFNWYGVPENIITDELVKSLNVGQYYQTIEGEVSYTNNGKRDDSFFKSTSSTLYRMWDRYGSYENRIKAEGEFVFPIEGQEIKIIADIDLLDNYFAESFATTDEINNRFLNIGITPSFEMIKENVTLNLGVKMVYSADLVGDNSQFKIFPKVNASVNVVDDLMIAYAGLEGEMYQNSYQSLVAEMPYLSPTQNIIPTSVQYNAFVGLRGKLTSSLAYNTSLGFRKENGFVQYLKNPGKGICGVTGCTPITNAMGWEVNNSFSAIQDTVSVLKFKAGVEYEAVKDLLINANLEYNYYSSENYDEVYNKPALMISANAEYRFLEDFTVGTAMYFVSSRSYIQDYFISNLDDTMTINKGGDLSSYFDLNINAGYDITKKLGTFVRFNNILNQNYELYKNYPVQGFQAMAGLTYKF